MYTLMTRDVGTISATAQSVRLEKSKLRYALQTYSLIEVSLVRGRGGWRVTNAYSLDNLFFSSKDKAKRDLVVKVSRLLRRLLAGESPDPDLFQVVVEGFRALSLVPVDEVRDFELVFVMRILAALGYAVDSEELRRTESQPITSTELRNFASNNRKLIVKEINTALRASGL